MDDKTIDVKVQEQIRSSYCESGFELVRILNCSWHRLNPEIDVPPHGLQFCNRGPHIYINERSLLLSQSKCEVGLFETAFLYTEVGLSLSEGGPIASPDDCAEIQEEVLDLRGAFTADVEKELCRHLQHSPDSFMKLLVQQVDPSNFIATIQSEHLKADLKKVWLRDARHWVEGRRV